MCKEMAMYKYMLLILLCSCANQEKLDTWNGHTEKELLSAWGAPASVYETDDGKILKYSHSRDIKGTSYYCDADFFLDINGVVINSTYNGNIGGCNRLIKRHP